MILQVTAGTSVFGWPSRRLTGGGGIPFWENPMDFAGIFFFWNLELKQEEEIHNLQGYMIGISCFKSLFSYFKAELCAFFSPKAGVGVGSPNGFHMCFGIAVPEKKINTPCAKRFTTSKGNNPLKTQHFSQVLLVSGDVLEMTFPLQ